MTGIGIVTAPSDEESFAEPVYRFITILEPSATRLTLFAGGVVARKSPLSTTIDVGDGEYLGVSLLDYIIFQLILCYHIVRHRTRLDVVYFHKGAMGLLLPLLFARVFGLRTCAIKIGAFHDERVDKEEIPDRLLAATQRIMFRLAHGVVVFSETEIDSIPNENVFVAFSNYRDFDEFDNRIQFAKRPVDLGFVGRFNELKGVRQFAEAALALVKEYPDLTIRLVGDGPQYETVDQLIGDHDRITLTGWIDHNHLASEYNKMRVLVAPSKAEGLPTGLIEAMGCGVIVVTSPVGSVGDLVTNGETGFHLPDRHPETIERTCKRIFDRADLENIGERARAHVVATYSKATAQERFVEITNSLIGDDGIKRLHEGHS